MKQLKVILSLNQRQQKVTKIVVISKFFLHGHIYNGSAEEDTDLFLLIFICVMSHVSCKKMISN